MLVAEGPLAADTGRAVDVGGNLATLGAAEGATLLATRSGIFTLALMTRSSWSSQAQPSAPVSKATTTPAVVFASAHLFVCVICFLRSAVVFDRTSR